MDPRNYMARVYRNVTDAETLKKFEAEINNCSGPEDAINICLRYL